LLAGTNGPGNQLRDFVFRVKKDTEDRAGLSLGDSTAMHNREFLIPGSVVPTGEQQ
jgi:hypothetical protein